MSAAGTRMGQEAGRSAASKPRLHVLLVEGDSADRDLILRELAKGEFEITSEVVQTAEEFCVQLQPKSVALRCARFHSLAKASDSVRNLVPRS